MITSMIGWMLFGLIAGAVARFLHPGYDRMGMVGTIILGILGSLLGGGIAYMLRLGISPYQPAGGSCRSSARSCCSGWVSSGSRDPRRRIDRIAELRPGEPTLHHDGTSMNPHAPKPVKTIIEPPDYVPPSLEGLERLAWLMDRAFKIPGTPIRVGPRRDHRAPAGRRRRRDGLDPGGDRRGRDDPLPASPSRSRRGWRRTSCSTSPSARSRSSATSSTSSSRRTPGTSSCSARSPQQRMLNKQVATAPSVALPRRARRPRSSGSLALRPDRLRRRWSPG